jgi:hypothetical protein
MKLGIGEECIMQVVEDMVFLIVVTPVLDGLRIEVGTQKDCGRFIGGVRFVWTRKSTL